MPFWTEQSKAKKEKTLSSSWLVKIRVSDLVSKDDVVSIELTILKQILQRTNLSSHLWDVGDRLHLNLGGTDDLRWSGIQNLHSNGNEETRSERHTFPKPLVQVLVLVHQRVLTSGAVHVDPGWTQGGQEPWRRFKQGIRLCDYSNIRHFKMSTAEASISKWSVK